jgi:hypothetical protein
VKWSRIADAGADRSTILQMAEVMHATVRLGIGPNPFVDRHKIGDWGDLDEAFKQENDIPPSTDSGFVEWKAHVKEAVLELADLMQEIKNAWRRADRAVRKARAGGVSWTTIGRVTGMTGESAHNRWSGLDSTAPTRT